jgi:HEAT repeats
LAATKHVATDIAESGARVAGRTAMDGMVCSKRRRSGLLVCLVTSAATAVAGCSTYIGTTAKSFLHHARENPDPNIRYIAYAKLGSPRIYETEAQKAEAVDTLIAKFEEGREPVAVRAVIIRSLGNLRARRARGVIKKAIGDTENAVIRVEACRALGKVGLPEDAATLARVMSIDKLEDCRIAAIEGIGMLKVVEPRIYLMLLDGMDHADPAIRFECLESLRSLTGKDMGVEPAAWRRELEPMLKVNSPATPAPTATAATAARQQPAATGGAPR